MMWRTGESLAYRPSVLAAVVIVALAVSIVKYAGGVSWVIATGSSMQPAINSGDLVFIRRAEAYRVGDIAAYTHPDLDRIILHRIIGFDDADGGTVITRGDNNAWTDSPSLLPEQLLGRTWARVPQAGRILSTLLEPATAAIVVGLAVFVPLAREPRRQRG